MNLQNVLLDPHALTVEPDQSEYNPFDEPEEGPDAYVVIHHAPVVVFKGTLSECVAFSAEAQAEQASREEGFMDAMAVKGE